MASQQDDSRPTASGAAAPTPTASKDSQPQFQPTLSANPPCSPKLTPAQMKAKAKAEKAARRAQAVAAKTASAGASSEGAAALSRSAQDKRSGGDNKHGPDSGRTASLVQQQQQSRGKPMIVAGIKSPHTVPAPDVKSAVPGCFSHVPMAKRIAISQANKEVHPAILALGQQMSAPPLCDSTARLCGTLLALREVIDSYKTPIGNSLSRHFLPHVFNPQIEYLSECRPMCFAMGNAIRLVKATVNRFDIDTPEEMAKKALLALMHNLLQDQVNLADPLVIKNASQLIGDGDIILTYQHHALVEKVLRHSWSNGTKFSLLILDHPHDHTGQELSKLLQQLGIKVTYAPHLGNLKVYLRRATKIFLGAEAMLANGSLYASAGTCDICLAASEMRTPVVALCQTINFDRDRMPIDALSYNEVDPERCVAENCRLLYDTTPAQYISMLVTEHGNHNGLSPASAIPSIIRKQDTLPQNKLEVISQMR